MPADISAYTLNSVTIHNLFTYGKNHENQIYDKISLRHFWTSNFLWSHSQMPNFISTKSWLKIISQTYHNNITKSSHKSPKTFYRRL